MEMTSSIYLLPILSPGARPCLEAVGKFSRVLKPFSCQKWPWTERREGSGLGGGAQPVSTGGGSEPNSGDRFRKRRTPWQVSPAAGRQVSWSAAASGGAGIERASLSVGTTGLGFACVSGTHAALRPRAGRGQPRPATRKGREESARVHASSLPAPRGSR